MEGPPRRRPDPHPVPGGRRVGRPADRPPAAPVRREGRRHRRRPRHRQVRPRPARRTRSPREEADLGRRPAHPDGVGVRRHQRAPHHRRHPLPRRPLPHVWPRRRGRREGRRRPAPRRPQGPRPRHPVHRWASSDPPRWSSSERSERSVETTRPADSPLPAPRQDRPRRRHLVEVGRAERLGPVTTDKIRDWLGNCTVRIQPVIRMDGDDAVNGHDPPDRIRDQVILRDPTCRFPGCQVDSTTLRPRPRHPLRPRRPARPNQTVQPRPALPTPPQRQDHRSVALHPHVRRRLRVGRPRGGDRRQSTRTSSTTTTTTATSACFQ